ncbi:MAG: alpha/beta fold hydrolase [Actinomycetota bacterium]
MRTHRLIATLACSALLVACGSDSDSADDTDLSPATADAEPDEASAPAATAATTEPAESTTTTTSTTVAETSPPSETTIADTTAPAETDVVDAAADAPPIVLVHGAWQDGSSWSRVQEALEADGRTVSVVSLPGRNGDGGAQTLTGYRDTVIAEVETYDDPVILMGHSFGGMTISNVAEAVPDQVDTLVYLAAYLPTDGDSLAALAEQDQTSVLSADGNLVISGDPPVASVPRESFAGIFCPDCDPADVDAVTASAVDEPAGPLLEPISLTEESFGAVPRVYISTAQDIVVGPDLQALMIVRTPIDEVFTLDTGHAPYVTAADEIADILEQLEVA